MDRVARLTSSERRELFRETAALRGMSPAVVEKDFWVCWVLKRLFSEPGLKDRMVFKGGTTLSKVFGLIDRFSEDIDLVLDWRLLGYGAGSEDPYREFDSNTKRDRFNKTVNQKAAQYIAGTLIHELSRLMAQCPQVGAAMDASDAYTINIAYPAAFPEAYLRPQVRLEIGPLASWVPSAHHVIQPYAAEVFPKVFVEPGCPVIAISAERTFWEKATILHQQAHRTGPMPSRYSRHYYDLYKLASSPVRDSALADLKLLRDVAAFKQRFYPCAWAKYEDATPGSLRLIPGEAHLAELRRDYRGMAVMIYRQAPEFDEIVDTIAILEARINRLGPVSA
jgi:predicted nucleotidyltransferase component of viral defense system